MPDEQTMCHGKRQFDRRRLAELEIQRLRRLNRRHGRAEAGRGDRLLAVYSCPHCGYFHVGHSKRKSAP